MHNIFLKSIHSFYMNITILGHVCIDTNISEHASYVAAGSPAMFMNSIFRQFPDTKTTIITPYGKDFIPYQGSAMLLPIQPTSDKTLMYENNSKHDLRKQKAYHRNDAIPVPLTSAIQKNLASTDILFIAPLLPHYSPAYIQSAITSTNPQAIKVLLPQGYYRAFDDTDNVIQRRFTEASEIIRLVDIVIVSEQDQTHMEQELISWTQINPHLIAVITMSDKGALAIQNKKKIMLPATSVPQKDIVDSVGSGDIFSAGFAYRYYQSKNILLSGAFANALAGQCLFFTPHNIKINHASLP